jgi:hypothetical protein
MCLLMKDLNGLKLEYIEYGIMVFCCGFGPQSRFDPLYSNNKREVTKVLSFGYLVDVSVSGFDSRLCDKKFGI